MDGSYSNDVTVPDNATNWMTFAQKSRDEGGLGLAKHQAAGLVGNLVNESGNDLSPWGPTGDNGTAWGTAQWRGDRLDNLKAFAQQNGMDHKTTEAQQAFMRHEFDTTEAPAYKQLLAAQDPVSAANAVNHLYERSADTSNKRAAAAQMLFNGQKLAPGAMTSAFANEDEGDDSETPALNANAMLGPGALNKRVMSGASSDNKASLIGQGLTGLGAALAGISSPSQAQALNQQLASMKKDNESKFKVLATKDGRIIRYDQDGNVDTYGGGQSATPGLDANGSPVMLGDPSKQGADYLKTLAPTDQQIINSWHDGTGIQPTSMQMRNPHVMSLMAAAKQAYPDADFTKIGERNTLAKDMAKSAPVSVGGQITNSNGAIQNLNNLADKYIALNNSNGFGPAFVAHGINAYHNATDGAGRNALIQALNTHADDASGEITKVLTGGPGGTHERAARKERLGNPMYSKEEAAGVLEAEANDLKGKHEMMVDHVKSTMGQAFLDRHPEIEQNFRDQHNALNDKIAQLREGSKKGGAATKPNTTYDWHPTNGLTEVK